MNAEIVGPDVGRRARVHAALGDPARLRIVDRLSVGDATPTELQALLGMPSNLVAHHVRTLESVGLVVRHTSEADRRRSYLQLVPAGLDRLAPTWVAAVPRVVFVCTANTARSQLAAALWGGVSDVPAASAGTHPAARVAAGALAVARRHSLPLAQTRPRSLDAILREGDYLVTVCDNAHEELARIDRLADPAGRAHWSVPDPVPSGTTEAFEAAFEDLTRRVRHLAPRLSAS